MFDASEISLHQLIIGKYPSNYHPPLCLACKSLLTYILTFTRARRFGHAVATTAVDVSAGTQRHLSENIGRGEYPCFFFPQTFWVPKGETRKGKTYPNHTPRKFKSKFATEKADWKTASFPFQKVTFRGWVNVAGSLQLHFSRKIDVQASLLFLRNTARNNTFFRFFIGYNLGFSLCNGPGNSSFVAAYSFLANVASWY